MDVKAVDDEVLDAFLVAIDVDEGGYEDAF